MVTLYYKQVRVVLTAKRSHSSQRPCSKIPDSAPFSYEQTQKKQGGGPLHLLAVAALGSEPPLVARHAVVVAFVRDERLGPNGFLTAMAGEAVLVPRRAVVLQHLGA